MHGSSFELERWSVENAKSKAITQQCVGHYREWKQLRKIVKQQNVQFCGTIQSQQQDSIWKQDIQLNGEWINLKSDRGVAVTAIQEFMYSKARDGNLHNAQRIIRLQQSMLWEISSKQHSQQCSQA